MVGGVHVPHGVHSVRSRLRDRTGAADRCARASRCIADQRSLVALDQRRGLRAARGASADAGHPPARTRVGAGGSHARRPAAMASSTGLSTGVRSSWTASGRPPATSWITALTLSGPISYRSPCPKGPSGSKEPRSHQGPSDHAGRFGRFVARWLPGRLTTVAPPGSPDGTRSASRCRYFRRANGVPTTRIGRPPSCHAGRHAWRPA